MIIFALLVAINTLYGCIIDMFDLEGFENKEQIISAVKENIDDLNKLTRAIYDKYYDTKDLSLTIDNKFFTINDNNFQYKTLLNNNLL